VQQQAAEPDIDSNLTLIMAPRPGSAAAKKLWRNTDVAAWEGALNAYDACIKPIQNGKGKATQHMKADDKWWRNELPETMRQRKSSHITKGELERVMRWKLARGKWRPLQKMVGENKEDDVVICSTKAFACLEKKSKAKRRPEDIKAAVTEMIALRAIGPATATAVLAAFCSDVPFMADEAMEGSIGERNYTMRHCMEFTNALQNRAKELGSHWTPEMVSRAMWAAAKSLEFGIKSGNPKKRPASPPPSKANKKRRGASAANKPVLEVEAGAGCRRQNIRVTRSSATE
jgi:hypothetical protein